MTAQHNMQRGQKVRDRVKAGRTQKALERAKTNPEGTDAQLLANEIEETRMDLMSFYGEACPGWAQHGDPDHMRNNIRRYREDMEEKLAKKKLESVQFRVKCSKAEKEIERLRGIIFTMGGNPDLGEKG